MSEIYWITRLDGLNGLLGGIITISAISLVLFMIFYLVGKEEGLENTQTYKKGFKCSLPIFITSSILCAFTPSKEDMFLIYGVGGTIDYIKQNDKAKQLPDRCIDALDAWVYNLNVEQRKK